MSSARDLRERKRATCFVGDSRCTGSSRESYLMGRIAILTKINRRRANDGSARATFIRHGHLVSNAEALFKFTNVRNNVSKLWITFVPPGSNLLHSSPADSP